MYSEPFELNTSRVMSLLVALIIFGPGIGLVLEKRPGQFTLNLLFLIPANTTPIANRTVNAIPVAFDRIREGGTLPDMGISWQVVDSQCSTTVVTRKLYDLWKRPTESPHFVFGGYCENVCTLLAIITNTLNLPFFVSGCRANSQRNYRLLPTFLTFDYDSAVGLPLLIILMEAYGWKRVAVLTTSDQTYFEIGMKAKTMVEAKNWTAIIFQTTMDLVPEGFISSTADEEVKLLLAELSKQARIIFFAMNKVHAARILLIAQRQGMYNGEFAFITYDISTVNVEIINATREEWNDARVGPLYLFITSTYEQLEGGKFVERMNEKLKDETLQAELGWLKRHSLDSQDEMHLISAGHLYLGVRFYAYLLNSSFTRMLNSSGDRVYQMGQIARNGAMLLSKVNESSSRLAKDNTDVNDNLGLRFDENGLRIPTWLIMNFQDLNTNKQLYRYDASASDESTFDKQQLVIWPGGVSVAPKDGPSCGWENEKCNPNKDLILICVCSVLGCLAIIGLFLAIFITRRMRFEEERRILAEWTVMWPQVTLLGDNVVGRFSIHETGRSKTSSEISHQNDGGEVRSVHRSTTNRLYTLTGIHKGKMVAIRKINRESVDIYQPVIYNELKQLFNLSHENVNPFMGVCAEAPNVCVLMLYADRGSLQDVLAETKYDINWEFKVCLATDVAKGMEYLHESPVGPHGHLTSTNCVVDRKWECRITDYGLKQFKRSKNLEMSTFRWNSDLLWTAPEILKKPETDQMRIYGSKEGDVYSFGIIVYEIITKEMPYSTQLVSLTPEEVVLSMKRDPMLRPILPEPEGPLAASWNSLATTCWHERPDVRPNFRVIRGRLRAINGGRIPNLMNRMQRMMEDALMRKETAIVAERKRTESVVYNLLPQNIGEKIVDGMDIRPQRFNAVTLCYCETSDILASVKALSPIQVTEVMTSLFLLYDEAMKGHKVIEISGRGSRDSMIMASGIPQVTKGHAEDICDLSLNLISASLTFRTPHTPDLSINLKISIHSGPVLTAVIWRTLPRYCVNGDTIETVMAMHRASKAMRVRISEATYGHIEKTGSFTVEQGGKVTTKDGTPMRTYWLTGKTGYRKPLPSATKRRSSSLKPETPPV